MITITHNKSGRKKEFSVPREAAAFLVDCAAKNIKETDLTIDNRSGVSLSIYTDRIPKWAQLLIERMERDHRAHVRSWHFIQKTKNFSTGHTFFRKEGIHIAISRGTNDIDFAGVIIHEYAHAMCPVGEHHGQRFYNTMFALLRQYLTIGQEKQIVKGEWNYTKSSRYWYAVYHNIEEILREYARPETVAARRLTAEEKTQETLNSLFED